MIPSNNLVSIAQDGNLGYWGERAIYQLAYAMKLSEAQGDKYNDRLKPIVEHVTKYYEDYRSITEDLVRFVEDELSDIKDIAKSYKVICVAHAHIDMNWMWSFDETVAITLDTFRTMLDLMSEYPEFKFSQSQASVYNIVEEYQPAMLEEIKKRVHEGRWEVTASTWVEGDKNIPNGESLARHILYTRRYLSELLDIDSADLDLDFEPDTFGHSMNVPEVLTRGGIKYYYHCRGYDEHVLYRWKSPSGNSIIAYREPTWYNAAIEPYMALYVPEFCTEHGLDSMLKVYGVGDHGGGPTRRDIEKIIDMNTWPIFPEIKFGTYDEFFEKVSKVENELPVVEGEQNFIFTGCYTSQSRIKMANSVGERTLNEAELFNAIATLTADSPYPGIDFEKAWRKILFNHFHDIIPGSCTREAREHAMGMFQESMAIANTNKSLAIRNIAKLIDTQSLHIGNTNIKDSTSEGAGVGYGVEDFKITQCERGRGKTRIFHVFNPSLYPREEVVTITVWDWDYDLNRVEFKDESGNVIVHQLIDNDFIHYWGHRYFRVLIKADVPACGYSTYTMSEKELDKVPLYYPRDPRVEKIDEFVLENDYIRVLFDSQDASIKSIINKETGEELISQNEKAGIFRYILEDESKGGTSWVVGRYMNIEPLTKNMRIKWMYGTNSPIRQAICYEIDFKESKLQVIAYLDADSPRLNFDVECEWLEIGKPGFGIPQLNFYLPIAYRCRSYKYDIPFGTIERQGKDMDVPANTFAIGVPTNEGQSALMLMTDVKHGFRCKENSLSLTLIRSSFDPDPYPEIGLHKFSIALQIVDADADNCKLIDCAYDYKHPLSVTSAVVQKGTFPLKHSFISKEQGSIAISGIKLCEDQYERMIVRIYETEGKDTKAKLRLFKEPKKAYFVDINEQVIDNGEIFIERDAVSFSVSSNSISTVCIEF